MSNKIPSLKIQKYNLDIEIWDLFGNWDLEIGISKLGSRNPR